MNENYIYKIAYIKKLPGNKWRVISEKGKNLGTYDSKEEAEKRLKQIEMFKHMKKKKASVIDLTDVDNFSLSAIMRKMRKECSNEQILDFLKIYKNYFDDAIKRGLENPEKLSLSKSLIDFNKSNPIKINKNVIKTAAITELGNPAQVGQYLANIIKFILRRISEKNRGKSILNLKSKLYNLNVNEIASKQMPASSALGQSITLVKHILFNHDPKYVKEVIDNIIINL
jgi:hypothetical protein